MKKMPVRFSLLLSILVFTFVSCSNTVASLAFGFERWKAGLERKELKVSPWDWTYLEGGNEKGEKILLVHGFGADKDNWTRFSAGLTKDYRVIAVDLPGFGENLRLPNEGYTIEQQVERLDRFTQGLGWEKFHIAGNSMGGCIAGVFAAKHPEKVLSLGVFAPGGINSPVKSELSRNMEKGKNTLIVTDQKDFEELMKFVFVNPPPIPSPMKSYFAEKAIQNAPFNKVIFNDIRKGFPLQENMKEIRAKTLILWGDTDRVLNVSGADVLEKGIPGSKKVILKDVGHAPMLEKPQDVSQIYRKFLSEKPFP
ncbi:alpha/beta fold hydrolase [Leptospira fluminis]|uniref:Alpha/beta fold hydrolase n=1 Tax=Leptospira fluminis TaxID=2484979 RepID=A0A4R9GPX9_9LEPT|nr:alpha/beta fold hydrolase [Leptospira fluminis]TGK19253.1 alpha/beta fold hydrolase [Leptospira fluminis]